jgi:tetratricopeptide (TPR) repeat protein
MWDWLKRTRRVPMPCPHCRFVNQQIRPDGRCLACGKLLAEEPGVPPEASVKQGPNVGVKGTDVSLAACYDDAMAHLKKGEYQQAIAEFTQVVRLDPDGPNGYAGRAVAYRALGDEAKAARDEDTAKELGGIEKTIWARLVNRAYQRARTGDLCQADRGEFYRRLDPVQREAVLLWELNSQVVNGGFPQWVFNGYAVWINDVIAAVEQIGTAAAKILHKILEDVSLLAHQRIESDQQREENLSKLLECTNGYYAVMGEFGRDVDIWLDARLQK